MNGYQDVSMRSKGKRLYPFVSKFPLSDEETNKELLNEYPANNTNKRAHKDQKSWEIARATKEANGKH